MKDNKLKKINRILRVITLTIVLGMCTQVYIPKAETKVVNDNLNKTLDLHAMAIRYEEMIKEDMFSPKDTFNGDITGYAADCELCSGYLGCYGQDVLTNRITHHYDEEYGNVRIVASSRNLPCGTIVEFALPTVSDEKIVAIVLDRGVLGTDLDLLVESEDYARSFVGRRYITYDVLRFGNKVNE